MYNDSITRKEYIKINNKIKIKGIKLCQNKI